MQQGIAVTASAKELRGLARWVLKDHWGTAIQIALLVFVVTEIPAALLEYTLGSESWADVSLGYTLLIQGPMELGMAMVFLSIFRRQQAGAVEVFYGFEHIVKVVMLNVITSLLILLQTLLLIIPGIIASYRYSLAVYILADDPSKGVMQCINESKAMTMGNKGKLFELHISFFGWMLLAILPSALITNYYPQNNRLVYQVMVTVSAILMYLLKPYMEMATLAVYEIANGNLRIKRENEMPPTAPPSGDEPHAPEP